MCNIEESTPLVSIIVPNYNGGTFLKDMINSVLGQTYHNWELIIVDDGSSDDSEFIVKKFVSEKIFFLKRPDNLLKGGNICRNLGIHKSKGKYIIFLDSDDLLAEFCLRQRVDFLVQNPDFDFAVFNMIVFRDKIKDGSVFTQLTTNVPLDHFWILDCIWQTTSPIWKKEFLLKIGGFSESYKRLQDPEITIRALLDKNVKYSLVKYSKPDAYYRASGIVSLKKIRLAYETLYTFIEDFYLNDNNKPRKQLVKYMSIYFSYMHFLCADQKDNNSYQMILQKLMSTHGFNSSCVKLCCRININIYLVKIFRIYPLKKIVSFIFKQYQKKVYRMIDGI